MLYIFRNNWNPSTLYVYQHHMLRKMMSSAISIHSYSNMLSMESGRLIFHARGFALGWSFSPMNNMKIAVHFGEENEYY
ncbi:MAG: hypothetical protein GPOALKHO_002007 [Sodalis sp.]|nr:MAG: hypothetical protein GPOALKHO_002007 [Sodalis sp.]